MRGLVGENGECLFFFSSHSLFFVYFLFFFFLLSFFLFCREWPVGQVPMPEILFHGDFGVPQEPRCHQDESNKWKFYRQWSSGLVEMNCATFEAKLPVAHS